MSHILVLIERGRKSLVTFCSTQLSVAVADTLDWVAIIVLHAATVPTVLGVLLGVSDSLPPVDLILFVWAGLAILFARSSIKRDLLNILTNGIGFLAQAVLLALIVFK